MKIFKDIIQTTLAIMAGVVLAVAVLLLVAALNLNWIVTIVLYIIISTVYIFEKEIKQWIHQLLQK